MVQTLKSPESSTTTSNIGNDLNTLKIVKLTHQTDLKIMKMIRLDHLPYSEKKLNTGYTIKCPYCQPNFQISQMISYTLKCLSH